MGLCIICSDLFKLASLDSNMGAIYHKYYTVFNMLFYSPDVI